MPGRDLEIAIDIEPDGARAQARKLLQNGGKLRVCEGPAVGADIVLGGFDDKDGRSVFGGWPAKREMPIVGLKLDRLQHAAAAQRQHYCCNQNGNTTGNDERVLSPFAQPLHCQRLILRGSASV